MVLILVSWQLQVNPGNLAWGGTQQQQSGPVSQSGFEPA